jgi:Holliday junction DNA helicase RuvA
MYDFIRGKLAKIYPTEITVEASGIGYRISVPISMHANLPALGESLTIYTSFVVRDMSQMLYGFLSENERSLFDILIGLTGVGPKVALSIIGHLPFADLQMAILKNDTKTLCLVPGIGKKSAERLVIELRDKIAAFAGSPSVYACQVPSASTLLSDAISALVNLGYNQLEAQRMVKRSLEIAPDATLSELITHALKTK